MSNKFNANLLISAFGIHTGGGLVLLKALLIASQGNLKEALLDVRVEDWPGIAGKSFIKRVPRRIWSRLSAQTFLAINAKKSDVLLSFNSLPPIVRSNAYVINYVHAPHFIGAHSGVAYTKKTMLRLIIERAWFRLGIKNCDEIWVQTESMYRSMTKQYPRLSIRVVPLVDDILINVISKQKPKIKLEDGSELSFIYPADGVGHKNHPRLLEAWRLLEKMGLYPKLILTLTPDELDLALISADLMDMNLTRIENLGRLSRSEVLSQIKSSSALIFPSLAETFGLPMLEAKLVGKPIIASERDFVRDVCSPVQTFDPESPHSIACSVYRFITGITEPSLDLFSAQRFIEEVMISNNN
jgi:glycosyltransferase involved in cell wall biosynthesis